ncbi:general secretion pathway protein GspB [uncultured Lamprocystis sp.]|jgi:general secretion pathway protein B|nr:general secretion pathway protein GspB [uncultured Lamprocystis sp.]
MSYILEALKKSQAERELGQVPTLHGAGLFTEDEAVPTRSPWILVSVGLAAAAVLIALYAALRQPLPVPPQVALPTAPPGAVERASPARLAVTPAVLDPAVTTPDRVDRQTPIVNPPVAAAAAPVAMSPASGTEGLRSFASGAPLVEAPPPKGAVRAPPAVLDPRGAALGRTPRPSDQGHHQDALEAELEVEIQRQLEADESYAEDTDEWIPVAQPEDPAPTPVPPDLIADIESFKNKTGQVQGRDGNRQPNESKVKAELSAPPQEPRYAGDLTKLRLTRDQQAGVPSFLMTVHVFEANQSRRFVLINGLKYRDGEKTREGLVVEQIVADGVVLSHQGNPFFVHR